MFLHETGWQRTRLVSCCFALSSGSGCRHPNIQQIACRLCREVFGPTEDVVVLAISHTVQAEHTKNTICRRAKRRKNATSDIIHAEGVRVGFPSSAPEGV
jgi:hypothetical protein